MTQVLHSHLLWYLNRGTGVVLVALLTLATALGVLATRGGSPRWPRFAVQSLHRNVSLLACVLLLLHAATPVVDTYVNHYAKITPVDALVPFASGYKTLALGLGTLALDLLALVVVTSLVRRRMTHRAWFAVHLLAYVSWGVGIAHGLLIGTDAQAAWSLAITGASIAAVGVAVVVRLVGGGKGRRTPEPALDPLARYLAVEPQLPVQEEPLPRHGRRRASA